MPKLDKANKARRDIESHELAKILRERNRSSANGTHADRRTRRLRTRLSQRNQALKDWA